MRVERKRGITCMYDNKMCFFFFLFMFLLLFKGNISLPSVFLRLRSSPPPIYNSPPNQDIY